MKENSLLALGQAKLIASFPFQDFQNIMQAEGHYSLFIMAKTLKKTLKYTHYYNNEIIVNKIYAVEIAI